RAAAVPALLRNIIDHHAVLRRVDDALVDLFLDILIASQRLLVNRLLGLAIGLGLDFLGIGLLLDPVQGALSLGNLALQVLGGADLVVVLQHPELFLDFVERELVAAQAGLFGVGLAGGVVALL